MTDTTRQPQDHIYPFTRWLAAFVIPFLAAAVAILYVWPEKSGELFAWPIQPPLTAMLLAAAYAGGIVFFLAVLLVPGWHTVKAGFWPVILFAGLLGIATILHWDSFNHQHISFYAWAGLYFTTPFLVLAAWLQNRGQDPGLRFSGQKVIAVPWRVFFAGVGLGTLVTGLLLFASPDLLIPVWPWKLSPLTARVVGSMFVLPGILGFQIAIDPRWSAARWLLASQFLSLFLMLIAMLRARSDFISGALGFWISLGTVSVIGLAILALFIRMRTRQTGLSNTKNEQDWAKTQTD